jgi:antitoxin HicB
MPLSGKEMLRLYLQTRESEMKYHFKIHREGSGFWAECVELKGCRTEGNTEVELRRNMSEALNLFLDDSPDSRQLFPMPMRDKKARSVVGVNVDPQIAFAFCLRQERLRAGLTQKEAAARLGFKNLYSYQRLEASKTANPELKTILQLKKIFPGLSLDKLLAA